MMSWCACRRLAHYALLLLEQSVRRSTPAAGVIAAALVLRVPACRAQFRSLLTSGAPRDPLPGAKHKAFGGALQALFAPAAACLVVKCHLTTQSHFVEQCVPSCCRAVAAGAAAGSHRVHGARVGRCGGMQSGSNCHRRYMTMCYSQPLPSSRAARPQA